MRSRSTVLNPQSPRIDSEKAGALVISLDFELHWGVRDRVGLDRAERKRLLQTRTMVEKILETFREFSARATWATVGALFCKTRDEFEQFSPDIRPDYIDSRLDPYGEQLGKSEDVDPFHFAPSLIDAIANTPGQEIGSHSFSHYYCLEQGQTAASFEADLRSAIEIANRSGHTIQSYVFPRNQANSNYIRILEKRGIRVYRGVAAAAPYQAGNFNEQVKWSNRGLRLVDTFTDLYGAQSVSWPELKSTADLRASRYLQPCRWWLRPFDSLKIERIVAQMEAAAEQGRIFHLWWHPEDFANGGEANIVALRKILSAFETLRNRKGMLTMNMSDTVMCGQQSVAAS